MLDPVTDARIRDVFRPMSPMNGNTESAQRLHQAILFTSLQDPTFAHHAQRAEAATCLGSLPTPL